MPAYRKKDVLNSVPIKNTVGTNIMNTDIKSSNIEQNILNTLIEERNKVHNTKTVLQTGVLTPITYFSQSNIPNQGDMINIEAANNLALNSNLYTKINNLEVKFLNAIELEDESSEMGKSFTLNGSIQFLPKTIKPKENDYFILYFNDSYKLYRVTKVNIDNPLLDAAITAEFTLADNGENFIYDDWVLKPNVIKEFNFVKEYYGTSYRCIIESTYSDTVAHLRELYQYLGMIYIQNFYNADFNLYFLKSDYFDFRTIEYGKNDIININGKELDISVPEEYYDEELAYFLRNNSIFLNIGSYNLFIPNDILPWNEIHYNNTIFKALENREAERFTNRKMIASQVLYSTGSTPPCLYGKYIITHVKDAHASEERRFLNPVLEDTIFNFNNKTPFAERDYASISNLMAETIGLFIRNENIEEILVRLEFIWKNKSKLHVSPEGIFPNNAYYLYPLLGYVINKVVAIKFNDIN